MSYTEDELLPLSALQHLLFCARQCALIHVERQWRDNALTIEGLHMHARVDEDGPHREVRKDLVVLRGIALRSFHLGLVGRADVVELHRPGPLLASETGPSGFVPSVPVANLDGNWVPYPLDYKRGKPKENRCDDVQLCAQALCLEEMLGAHIPVGALFYGRQRRRHEVCFDNELRVLTSETSTRLHELIASGETPSAPKQKKCERCSMLLVCMPEAMSASRSAADYLASQIRDASGGEAL
ncbi:MAG: CRISPR-associated protein Cas4 [Deltaproteobacteria bacterium RIFOXYA12_FULL_58_15]|nr:MAG: CRISPR-associated protein Cas4 [Deltaproteobacteria bacterium RIFOXYA12_FULL_58_15]OGR14280.1 MAG: CRISPR-associated protein Cas4 [Deltaproteobacteria bacterium RIFOXYB12_FULL_58_9]